MKSSKVIAIAVTGFVALVAVGWGISARQGYLHRSRATDVINEIVRVRDLVAGDLAARKPGGPVKRDFKSESPMVTHVAVDYEARSIAAFVNSDNFGYPNLPRGASVTWTAVGDGPNVEWRCSATVPAKLLPANCR